MYKTGVMEEMVFINPMKIAWKDIKPRQNRSQTVNITENSSSLTIM
jgi:hypothetical protein